MQYVAFSALQSVSDRVYVFFEEFSKLVHYSGVLRLQLHDLL